MNYKENILARYPKATKAASAVLVFLALETAVVILGGCDPKKEGQNSPAPIGSTDKSKDKIPTLIFTPISAPTPNIDATFFARMTEYALKSTPATVKVIAPQPTPKTPEPQRSPEARIEFPSSIEQTARDYAQAALNGDLETIIRLSAPDVQAKIKNNPEVRQGYQDELDSLSFCRGRVSLQAPVTRGDQNIKIITFPFNTACRSKTIIGVPGASKIFGLSTPIDVIRDNFAVVFQKTNGIDQITGFQLFNYTPVTK